MKERKKKIKREFVFDLEKNVLFETLSDLIVMKERKKECVCERERERESMKCISF